MADGSIARPLRAVGKWLGLGLGAAVLVLLAALIATARPGDRSLWPPPAGAPAVELFVVSHGYHSGLVLPRAALEEQASRRGARALGAVATRFAGFERLEIGWGDEEFYRSVPTMGSLGVGMALRALLRPGNASVLHVVGIGDPRATFTRSDMVRVAVGKQGFDRLADRIEETFVRDASGLPDELGPGLYGPSLFFRAKGHFHLFNVCNHWVARMLDAAGIPTTPVLDTLPAGLLLDLEWRAGLTRLPPAR
jgi:uncharacterized protein (TIGR02117 family)